MTYSTAAKVSRMLKTMLDLAGGSLRLRDSEGGTLRSFPLASPAGAVAGEGLLTFGGFPQTVSSGSAGTVAEVVLCDAAGAVYKTVTSVGVPGSGAQVIVDNGAATLSIGDSGGVQVAAAPTLAHY